MKTKTIKVLLIDDDEDDYILTRELLSEVKVGNYALDWASSYEEGLKIVARQEHDVCLVDYHLGERSGVQLIREARESRFRMPMILMTGQGTDEVDFEAMQAGAIGYLIKYETPTARLERTLRYAVELNTEHSRAEEALGAYAQKHAVVAEIGRMALTGGDLNDLLADTVILVARTLGVEYCELLELLPDGEHLLLTAGLGWKEDYAIGHARVSAGKDSHAGFTLLSDEPVVVEDLQTETRFRAALLLYEHGVVSGMTVIIQGRERPYGVLGAHTSSKRRFAADDVNFLRSVANVLAEAIARKRVEDKVSQSEARFRRVVESKMLGIVSWDLSGAITEANDAFLKMVGYTAEDSAAGLMSWSEMTPPEYRSLDEKAIDELAAYGVCKTYEKEYIRKDGSRVPILLGCATLDRDTQRGVGFVLDITERRRAEQELRETVRSKAESLALLDSILSTAPIGFAFHNRDLAYQRINETLAAINGLSVEQHLGKTLSEVLPEMSPVLEPLMQRVMDTGKPILDFEISGETPADSSYQHHWSVSFYPVRMQGGELLGVGVLVSEITERKQAEEALRESEARNRAILESSMDCIIGMDHQGLVVDWNPAAEETFGYSRKEAIGGDMAELIIPERYRERHRQGLTRYLATGQGRLVGQRLELSAQRSDGTEFPIELTITRIKSKGDPIFTGYLRDITKRKKAELRLSAQYAVTRALAESNTITEGASKILQAACESLGWEYGSLWIVDRSANALRCSEVWQAPGAEAVEFESASRQSVFNLGVGLPGRVWSDREPVWIPDLAEDANFPRAPVAAIAGLHSGCAFPIRFRSEILGVMEFFSHSIRESDPDLLAMMVTIGSQIGQFIERKRVEGALGESEEQLRQSQKLEAIGQLAGGVAHDFNNLLTVIGGYSSILLGKLPQDSPHRLSIEEIKRAGDRAAGLTRQLLAFSRKQILQPRVLDLNLVVTDLEKMVRRLIGEDIDLLTITSAELGKVKADPGQIEQVLLNLIVNARDAMPKGGKLTIETRNVEHSEEYALPHEALPGHCVMLTVSDNGCGMDAAVQLRVFEPFFTTKGAGKGTGLGLATVYGIVKQSGGNISVYSEVGRGTTFKIWLPRVDEAAESEGEGVSKTIPKGTETVLLIEDEDQVRTIVKEILEAQGYHVLAASNGEEALTIAQDLQLDIKIMITDVVMPQMSGRELAERITAHRPGLPVLFMSGYTDDAIVRHGLLDEKLNFLQKPFDSATVARKVREVLDSELYATLA